MWSKENEEALIVEKTGLLEASTDRVLTEGESARLGEITRQFTEWGNCQTLTARLASAFSGSCEALITNPSIRYSAASSVRSMAEYFHNIPKSRAEWTEFRGKLNNTQNMKASAGWNAFAAWLDQRYNFFLPQLKAGVATKEAHMGDIDLGTQRSILFVLSSRLEITQYEARMLTPAHFRSVPGKAETQIRLDDHGTVETLASSDPDFKSILSSITGRRVMLGSWAETNKRPPDKIPFFCDLASPMSVGSTWWRTMIDAGGLYLPISTRMLSLKSAQSFAHTIELKDKGMLEALYRRELMDHGLNFDPADAAPLL